MRKSRFSAAQIVGILKEVEAGISSTEVSREHGVHANMIRLWRSKYDVLDVSDLARLKQHEAENSQMERIIARQALEIDAMKNLFSKTAGALAISRFLEGWYNYSPATHLTRQDLTDGVRTPDDSNRVMSNQAPSTKAAQLQPSQGY